MLISAHTYFLLIVIINTQLSTALSWDSISPWGMYAISGAKRPAPISDIPYNTLHLEIEESQLSEVYGLALASIRSLKSSGNTCGSIVTASLVESCRSLAANGNDFDDSLEDFHTQLAAVLALCELRRDPANWPAECLALKNPGQALKSNIKQCFVWLKADGKRWTSYSNNRANLENICHAERYRTAKDEWINAQEKVMLTNQKATAMTEQYQAFVESELMKRKEYSGAIDDITREVQDTLQRIPHTIREMIAQISDDIKTDITEPLKEGRVVIAKANLGMATMIQNLENASAIERALQMLRMNDHAEYANAEIERRERQFEKLSELDTVLTRIVYDIGPLIDIYMQGLLQNTKHLDIEIEKSLMRTREMSAQTDLLQQQLHTLNDVFGGFLSTIASFWGGIITSILPLLLFGFIFISIIFIAILIKYQYWTLTWGISFIAVLSMAATSASSVAEDLGWIGNRVVSDNNGTASNLKGNLLGFILSLLLMIILLGSSFEKVISISILRGFIQRRRAMRKVFGTPQNNDFIPPPTPRKAVASKRHIRGKDIGVKFTTPKRSLRAASAPPGSCLS